MTVISLADECVECLLGVSEQVLMGLEPFPALSGCLALSLRFLGLALSLSVVKRTLWGADLLGRFVGLELSLTDLAGF